MHQGECFLKTSKTCFVTILCDVVRPRFKSELQRKFFKDLTLLGWGAESARTIFKLPFLHEKRVLEVPNFVTFQKETTKQEEADNYMNIFVWKISKKNSSRLNTVLSL